MKLGENKIDDVVDNTQKFLASMPMNGEQKRRFTELIKSLIEYSLDVSCDVAKASGVPVKYNKEN